MVPHRAVSSLQLPGHLSKRAEGSQSHPFLSGEQMGDRRALKQQSESSRLWNQTRICSLAMCMLLVCLFALPNRKIPGSTLPGVAPADRGPVRRAIMLDLVSLTIATADE